MNTEIKILHSSCCAKGSPIKEKLEKLAKEYKLAITITELSELQDTMIYGTMSFPSLVVNNKVYDFKSFKSEKEIIRALKTL